LKRDRVRESGTTKTPFQLASRTTGLSGDITIARTGDA
jgi:hypothetical protein